MLSTQLRAFHAVATTGGFTKAAESLNVTQPTISGQVRDLEQTYEVQLFHRRGRTVTLTETGHRLFATTQRLVAVEEEAREILDESRNLTGGVVRLGGDAPHHALPLVAAFRRRHPGVSVSLSIDNTDSLTRELLAYRIDIAVLCNPQVDPALHYLPLRTDPMVALCPAGHPWAQAQATGIAMTAFADQVLVLREPGSETRRVAERVLEDAGVVPGDWVEVATREGVHEAVAQGLGVGLVSSAEVSRDPRVVALPLDGVNAPFTECVVCLRDQRRRAAVKAFLAVTRLQAKAFATESNID
ncbi:LysR substrate-binding domain-containing protein [Rhodospirillum sp. A1_3_36]|uniref:LysR substrate-binding domain-containing protein n=1 Tax=Rhodospirillum sp. A1_3_36 TaxID=3391666 RepID=UPI0039A40C6B